MPDSQSRTRVRDALEAQGVNICDKKDNRVIAGPEVARAVRALAVEAGAAFNDQLEARCKLVDDEGGMTEKAMDSLKGFDDVINEAIKIQKEILSEIRSYRMTLVSELAMIETAIKKIQSLGTPKLVSDLEAIGKALSNPYIQKLLKGESDGN